MNAGHNPERWEGAALYSARTLRLYDLIVLQISNRWAWKCPTPHQLGFYNQHISANHLDVGVGSGYYSAHADFAPSGQRLALMDLNPECLSYALARMAGQTVKPTSHVADVLAPIPWEAERFDSVSLFYLLHCVPGSMAEKAVAFDHLSALLNPGGVIFGTSIMGQGGAPNWMARKLMDVYNAKSVFSNREDDAETLEQALNDRFAKVAFEVIGEVALFSARKH